MKRHILDVQDKGKMVSKKIKLIQINRSRKEAQEKIIIPKIVDKVLLKYMPLLDKKDSVEVLNKLHRILHLYSPFQSEPVDCVQWVPLDDVQANDYNPNVVAPPEMKLLEQSILEDGYTQPIVAWKNEDCYEVVDGFHRNRVGRECRVINKRIQGYLPLSIINVDKEDRGNRIASTIRHNRARGKHTVEGMSDIVIELKGRNWANARIARELGMEEDEILRLCQISGLSGLFEDQEFSKSWDVEGETYDSDFVPLSDDKETFGDEVGDFRTVNTNDEDRVFHKWDKWECYKAGLYNTTKEGMTREECEQAYCDFLKDIPRFRKALRQVIKEWKFSCEHYLTNKAMNRIAYLGQASVCYDMGIPEVFRNGFNLMSEKEQRNANEKALIYLNKWLKANGRNEVSLEGALGGQDRQMDLY